MDGLNKYFQGRGGNNLRDATTVGYDSPPPPNTPKVPTNGWQATDELLNNIGWRISCLLDLMRGVDCNRGPIKDHGGDAPWEAEPIFLYQNPSLPSSSAMPLSRKAAWQSYVNDQYYDVNLLCNELIDNGNVGPTGTPISAGLDLPGKAEFLNLKGLLSSFTAAPDTTIILKAAPVVDSAWALVNATSHPLDRGNASTFVSKLSDAIRNYTLPVNVTVSSTTTTINLRSPNYIRVAEADEVVNSLINHANWMLAASAAGVTKTFSRYQQWRQVYVLIGQDLMKVYDLVTNVTRPSVLTSPPEVAVAYRNFENDIIGDPASATTTNLFGIYNSWSTDLEPFPPINPHIDIDVGDMQSGHRLKVHASVVALSRACRRTVNGYINCRDGLLLNSDHCDGLFKDILAAVIALRTDYVDPRSWAVRVQGFQHKWDLRQAVQIFLDAIVADPDMQANTINTGSDITHWNLDARELIDSIERLGGGAPSTPLTLKEAIDNLYEPSCDIPPSVSGIGAPKEPAVVTNLINPSLYPTTTVDLGRQVAVLLQAIFRNKSGAWDGIRTRYINLRNNSIKTGGSKVGLPLVDPASDVYVNVSDAAVNFAQACFDFAAKPAEALIVAGAAAKSQLVTNLRLLEQHVLMSLPLSNRYDPTNNPGLKTEFSDAIRRATKALMVVPILEFPDQGASASLQVARPLTESQRLIHYKSAPTESVTFASDPDTVISSAGQKVVLKAKTPEDLEGMVARLPKHGPSLVFGLVVDRPGDMTALYKAVAIRLDLRLPPEIERKVADRKNAATGWLYNIVQFESGAYYTSQHDYIKPELYAV